jgi:hypothetical protein
VWEIKEGRDGAGESEIGGGFLQEYAWYVVLLFVAMIGLVFVQLLNSATAQQIIGIIISVVQ